MHFGKLMSHPLSGYSQGLNDIAGPIFAVFLAEKLNMSYLALENNIRDMKALLNDDIVIEVG